MTEDVFAPDAEDNYVDEGVAGDGTEGSAGDGAEGSVADNVERFPGGPHDPSVLTSFAEHVAHSIWNGEVFIIFK